MAYPSEDFALLNAGYLFPEIARRIGEWQQRNPGEKVLRLGIGNTTEQGASGSGSRGIRARRS